VPVPQGPDERRIRWLAHCQLDYMSEETVDWLWDKFVGGSGPNSFGEALVYEEWHREGYLAKYRGHPKLPGFLGPPQYWA
jgi:hypothetical protein